MNSLYWWGNFQGTVQQQQDWANGVSSYNPNYNGWFNLASGDPNAVGFSPNKNAPPANIGPAPGPLAVPMGEIYDAKVGLWGEVYAVASGALYGYGAGGFGPITNLTQAQVLSEIGSTAVAQSQIHSNVFGSPVMQLALIGAALIVAPSIMAYEAGTGASTATAATAATAAPSDALSVATGGGITGSAGGATVESSALLGPEAGASYTDVAAGASAAASDAGAASWMPSPTSLVNDATAGVKAATGGLVTSLPAAAGLLATVIKLVKGQPTSNTAINPATGMPYGAINPATGLPYGAVASSGINAQTLQGMLPVLAIGAVALILLNRR